jgi:hypothetical protein
MRLSISQFASSSSTQSTVLLLLDAFRITGSPAAQDGLELIQGKA